MFKEVVLRTPTTHFDLRGDLFEVFRRESYGEEFVQAISFRSEKGVVRGMQGQKGQAKLITVLLGEIYDVVVDIRKDSSTFGKWQPYKLNDKRHHQLFIPDGFAHGFCVLSQMAVVLCHVSAYYDPQLEIAFRFDDTDLAIDWPIDYPLVSLNDGKALSFKEVLK
jgi:dTDP-4-dehydrorhamnose 3,5-epimerase